MRVPFSSTSATYTTHCIIMFDWLRDLRKSQEEKQKERLTAYLDNALLPRERQALEQELARNETLQAELTSLRTLKATLRQLPRVPVPRQFTLSPATVAKPVVSSRPTLYPALRLATVLTAFLLVALLMFERLPQVGQSAEMANDVAYYDESGADDAVAGNAAANGDEIRNTTAEDTAESAPMVAAESEADESVAEEPASEPAEDSGAEEEVDAAAPATQDSGESAVAMTAPAPTLTPTSTATSTPTPTVTPTSAPTLTPTPEPPVTPPTPPPSPLRLAQIGLGVFFLVLLVTTLRLRRVRE